jgi:hypothetical protein
MNFKYNGESLNIVTNFQYLGIIFSCKGSFNDAKAHLVQQARKAMFIDMQLELFGTTIVSNSSNCISIGKFNFLAFLKDYEHGLSCLLYKMCFRIIKRTFT